MLKSTQISETIFLTEKLAELEKRIEVLERYLFAMDSEDGIIDLALEQHRYREGPSLKVVREPVPAKLGRRPRIPTEEFVRRRDELVVFLEVRWPDLQERMKEPGTLKRLLRAIKLASPGAQSTWQYQQLTEHIASLWEFLGSGRYRGQPWQIANAMAGVPQISWRTSLDRGTKHPLHQL